ncbi:MAG: hypothetical protein HOW73_21590 [Polyangiaceae bacterium]|nr:hypothetical protein [Polyangiaceae bacterium]
MSGTEPKSSTVDTIAAPPDDARSSGWVAVDRSTGSAPPSIELASPSSKGEGDWAILSRSLKPQSGRPPPPPPSQPRSGPLPRLPSPVPRANPSAARFVEGDRGKTGPRPTLTSSQLLPPPSSGERRLPDVAPPPMRSTLPADTYPALPALPASPKRRPPPLPRRAPSLSERQFIVRRGERSGEIVLEVLPVGVKAPEAAIAVRLSAERFEDARLILQFFE